MRRVPSRREQELAARRRARRIGAVGFLAAAVLPWLVFGRVIRAIATDFRLEASYLVQGWTPWVLITLGLLFLVPVAASAGRDPYGRWYPRARNAYAGWGISLYVLGCLIGSQVMQIVDGFAR